MPQSKGTWRVKMGKKPRPKNVSTPVQSTTPVPTQPATNGNAVAAPSPPPAADSSCVSEAVALVASGKSEYLPEQIYHNERALLDALGCSRLFLR
jgi:hypothetical protein